MPAQSQAIKVGDQVKYVPNECHAFDIDSQGNTAWVFKSNKTQKELTTGQVIEHKSMVAKQRANKGDVIPHAPRSTWDATVIEIDSETKAATLNIASVQVGVRLEYKNIQFDKTGKIPHTYHK